MSQEIHLWCYESIRYASAAGTLGYNYCFPRKTLLTNKLQTTLKLGVMNCCCKIATIPKYRVLSMLWFQTKQSIEIKKELGSKSKSNTKYKKILNA